MRKLNFAIAGAVAALALACGPVLAAPVKIRAAYIVPGTNLFSIFNAKPELIPHSGKSYTLEPVRYQATPNMITAMAVGDLDIALINSTALSLGVENAGMDDLRIFADEFRDAVDGYGTNAFMVRKDGAKTAADLKGKVVATNAIGSMVDIAMRIWMRKQGLEDKRDYSVVEAPLPSMKSLLLEKKAELVSSVPPFLFDPELLAGARPLFTTREAMGPGELGLWGASDAFLKKNREAIVDLLEDTMRVTRWYTDPKNHDEAMKIIAETTKAPAALFSSWMYTKQDYYRDPSLLPDVEAVKSNIAAQAQLGFVKGKLDVAKHIDTSYAVDAAKRSK